MIDEEKQLNAERGEGGGEADDHAYRLVFQALKQKPRYELSGNFAARVLKRLQPESRSSRDMIWLCAGILFFAIAMLVAIVLTGFAPNLSALSPYGRFLAFAIVIIAFFQWVDKRFVRRTT